MSKKLQMGVNLGFSNNSYHEDRTFLSSSVLKTIYKDIAAYKLQYIDGVEKEKPKNQTALDDGTLAHMLILEPELVASEVAVYPGLFKRGKEYDNFVSQTILDSERAGLPTPLIVSQAQWLRSQELLASYKSNKTARKLIEASEKEYTVCSELLGVPVKMRADAIDVENGIITDIKTTGYASGVDVFKGTLNMLSYELSAALYCMIAEAHYKRPFTFYFVVLSKSDKRCEVYRTSKETRLMGENMVKTALKKYITAKSTNVWAENSVSIPAVQTDEVQEV